MNYVSKSLYIYIHMVSLAADGTRVKLEEHPESLIEGS